MDEIKILPLHIEEISDEAISQFLVQQGWQFATFEEMGVWTRNAEDLQLKSWFRPDQDNPGNFVYGGEAHEEALGRFMWGLSLAQKLALLSQLLAK